MSTEAYAYGQPLIQGVIRSTPRDFNVTEQLSFALEGQGQHVYLFIRKTDLNTMDVVKCLARFVGCKPKDIGYAGLKDKRAQTQQWFSVDLAGKEQPDWQQINNEKLEVLQVQRHRAKLKRGAVKSNEFEIIIRDLQGDFAELESRVAQIAGHAVPNYFGEQRFGANDYNVRQAEALFKGELRLKNRHLKGIYLSAARSYLFNQLLSSRVADGSWQQLLSGEVLMLDGSHSVFLSEAGQQQELEQRLRDYDVHTTGPLWGAGRSMAVAEVGQRETKLTEQHPLLCQGLCEHGMRQERRALRLRPQGLALAFSDNTACLKFSLPGGCFATSVLREICRCSM